MTNTVSQAAPVRHLPRPATLRGWLHRLRFTLARRTLQLGLLLGTAEWLWSAFSLVQQRLALGQPWKRLALILLAVALGTAASALVFRHPSLRRRFGSRRAPGRPAVQLHGLPRAAGRGALQGPARLGTAPMRRT